MQPAPASPEGNPPPPLEGAAPAEEPANDNADAAAVKEAPAAVLEDEEAKEQEEDGDGRREEEEPRRAGRGRKRGRRGGGGGAARGVVMVRRELLARCMTCPLCNRLLRDATTISECLHTCEFPSLSQPSGSAVKAPSDVFGGCLLYAPTIRFSNVGSRLI